MKPCVYLFFISSIASACPHESKLPSDALQILYKKPEILAYICVERSNCSKNEFLASLDVKEIILSTRPHEEIKAIMVEPIKKGRQYFTAIFMISACKSHMIFSPDTSLSGLKVMPNSKNGLHVLRGTERESTESWKETDYGYNLRAKQYAEIGTKCFSEKNGKTVAVKCGG